MRKITQNAVHAFMNGLKFNEGNMSIEVKPNVTVMKLHGNAIAYLYNDPERTLSITSAGWETVTTKDRLNALPGVSIYQKNWDWYLNGEKWDGRLTDIKY